MHGQSSIITPARPALTTDTDKHMDYTPSRAQPDDMYIIIPIYWLLNSQKAFKWLKTLQCKWLSLSHLEEKNYLLTFPSHFL